MFVLYVTLLYLVLILFFGILLPLLTEVVPTTLSKKAFYAIHVMAIALPLVLFTISSYYQVVEIRNEIEEKVANIKTEEKYMDETLEGINALVERYVETETDIIKDVQLNNNTAIVIGQIYPEIKSDKMFTRLINAHQTHKSNINKEKKEYNKLIKEKKVLSKKIPFKFFIKSPETLKYLE